MIISNNKNQFYELSRLPSYNLKMLKRFVENRSEKFNLPNITVILKQYL